MSLFVVVARDEALVVRRDVEEELVIDAVVLVELAEVLLDKIRDVDAFSRLYAVPEVPDLELKVVARDNAVI